MSATFTLIGLDELRAALLNLPAELTAQAASIVTTAADAAAAEIKDGYPEGETGNLRRGVRVSHGGARTPHTVRATVRSTAPHAQLFETGTQTRQTKLGYGRGFMFAKNAPAVSSGWAAGPKRGANIFVPVVTRYRRKMLEDMLPIIEKQGLDVRR